MLEGLKDLIGKSLQRHSLDAHYTANTILEGCADLINEHTPENIAAHVKPTSYQHGVIFLSITHQIAGQEFRMYADFVLKELQKKYPSEDIRQFGFRLGSVNRDADKI